MKLFLHESINIVEYEITEQICVSKIGIKKLKNENELYLK